MGVWLEEELEHLEPDEMLKVLIELRHRFQTLVNQEVWEELCEIGRGQIENLRKEARALPTSLDNMLLRETIEAQAKGVEQILKTPEAFIADLTETIDALAEQGPEEGSNEVS